MSALRSLPATLFGCLGALALIAWLSGCGERYAGNSTGVDNPALTVAFRDDGGHALRVTGELDIFDADQNPALDPDPIWTVVIRNSALADIKDDYLLNSAPAAKLAALAKSAAIEGDGKVRFNLSFKSQSDSGALAFGLVYDSAAKAFTVDGGAKLDGFDLKPRQLVRYHADLLRDVVKFEGITRVYIPGTPFIATLTDTGFIFEGLPQGAFPIRVLAQDGRVFSVKESLETSTTRDFTCNPVPIDTVRKQPGPDPVPKFTVDAIANPGQVEMTHEQIDMTKDTAEAFLEAKVSGIDMNDPRISYRWHQLPPAVDTPLMRAGIDGQDKRVARALFKRPGLYDFELGVIFGTRQVLDTVRVVVYAPQVRDSLPRILSPTPGTKIPAGTPTKIAWTLPKEGPVHIELSLDSGLTWKTLAENYVAKETPPRTYAWIPGRELPTSEKALIQVKLAADTNVIAQMDGPFFLVGPTKQ